MIGWRFADMDELSDTLLALSGYMNILHDRLGLHEEMKRRVKASAGRSSLKPVPTGFSSRQGTTIALRAARAVLRPPRNDTSLRSHRPMATTMTLRRSLHLAGSPWGPARCLGYAGAWKTSRHRQ